MVALATQPIAGVSANKETTIETVFPGVAATGIGRIIGSILGGVAKVPLLPLRLLMFIAVGGILLPFGLLSYLLLKAFGDCYEITNRSVRQRKVIGGNLIKEVPLVDAADVQVVVQESYQFHRVGDVQLLSSRGDVLMTIPAIQFPQRLQHVLLDAREARLRSDESLKHIQERQ